MKTETLDYQRSIWLGGLVLIVCSQALPSWADIEEPELEDVIEDHFQPNYRPHKLDYVPLSVAMGESNSNHFDAFGLDNAALERAAADLSENRMMSSHRVMNHHWLYIESQKLKWENGSNIITAFCKAKARQYWDSYLSARQQRQREANPAANRADYSSNVIYDMDLSEDSIEFLFTYQFH